MNLDEIDMLKNEIASMQEQLSLAYKRINELIHEKNQEGKERRLLGLKGTCEYCGK
jgi:hypothetical protein